MYGLRPSGDPRTPEERKRSVEELQAQLSEAVEVRRDREQRVEYRSRRTSLRMKSA